MTIDKMHPLYKIIFEQIQSHVWCDGFYFSDEIIFSRGLTWDDTAAIDWISVHRLVSPNRV